VTARRSAARAGQGPARLVRRKQRHPTTKGRAARVNEPPRAGYVRSDEWTAGVTAASRFRQALQLVPDDSCMRVVRAESGLVDGQRTRVQRPGVVVSSLILEQQGQVVQARGRLRVVLARAAGRGWRARARTAAVPRRRLPGAWSEMLLPDRERPFVEVACFGLRSLLQEQGGQAVQTLGRIAVSWPRCARTGSAASRAMCLSSELLRSARGWYCKDRYLSAIGSERCRHGR
jgi:hypothetical protein